MSVDKPDEFAIVDAASRANWYQREYEKACKKIEELNGHLKEDDELMQSRLKRLNELHGEIVELKQEIRDHKDEIDRLTDLLD